jgi:hypothetical protein
MVFLLRCLFWLVLVMVLAGHAPKGAIESLALRPGQATGQRPAPQSGGQWLAEACLSAPERCREAGAVLAPLAAAAGPAAEAVGKRWAAAKTKRSCSDPACPKP